MTGQYHPWPMTVVLWGMFGVIVAAIAVLLLRACALSALLRDVMPYDLNFCPSQPAGLSAEAERAGEKRALVSRLEADLARKRLDCASIPPPPPPPLQLPAEAGELRPQQTAERKAPPPPPPPLPADRWAKGDLRMLEGCWRLGREAPSAIGEYNWSEPCLVKTGRICFGANGTGRREASMVCRRWGEISCTAPVTASFTGGNRLQTTQPQVYCTKSVDWWSPGNDLTCQRVNDALAVCRDGGGFEYEFRR